MFQYDSNEGYDHVSFVELRPFDDADFVRTLELLAVRPMGRSDRKELTWPQPFDRVLSRRYYGSRLDSAAGEFLGIFTESGAVMTRVSGPVTGCCIILRSIR